MDIPEQYLQYFRDHGIPAAGYILGLDLGIASVGWACVLVDEDGNPLLLLDLGVRTFERAEVPKTGESLALARRTARSARRRLRRRAHRLLRLKRLLRHTGLLSPADFDADGHPYGLPVDVWPLRLKGLDERLAPQEWAAVLLHMVKHRGYLSQRKNEAQSEDKELGRLLAGVAQNHTALQSGDYRTPAELALKQLAPASGHLRNKGGDYSHTFSRLDIQQELHTLFAAQRRLGNPFATPELEAQTDKLLMTQRSALQGNAILKMLGTCTFETTEYRAAKHTYTAERFIWLTKLNNLRIQHEGSERPLTPDERALLLDQPYRKAKLTYKQVRTLLELPNHAIFKGLRYGHSEDGLAIEGKTTLMEMKAYHQIRQALEKANLKTEWQSLASAPEKLDAIGTAFSLYKTDEDIRTHLAPLALPDPVLEALLAGLNFDKFIQLSLKALARILPHMENGMRYDEAAAAEYAPPEKQAFPLLPHIPEDRIRNPVVLRSLTQARKVINAVIRRYGSPLRVHIETGRELGKSYDERRKIENRQKENQADHQRAIEHFKEMFPSYPGEPKALDILRLRLYHQQQGKCLYSGKPIDLQRLNEKGYAEVDHALPFSRTWDNSLNNKVLVLCAENRNKGNRTPYEYLNGAADSPEWQAFAARVSTSTFPYAKKQRIMLKKLDEQGFIERNLNDTRYIARFLTGFIEDHLHLLGAGKKRVFASNGQLTAFLRNSWGLGKVREANNRHHALDAIVVACTTPTMQRKITDYIRRKEMDPFSGEMVDRSTGEIHRLHFPDPWPFFRQEIILRIFDDAPAETLRTQLLDRPHALHPWVTPLFVSRPLDKKIRGQSHDATIRSPIHRDTEKIPLTELTPQDIERIIGYPNREPLLYQALAERLRTHAGNPAAAFSTPFYKPGKGGTLGARVKSVRVTRKKQNKSGFLLRNNTAIAENPKMVRIDVFNKAGKYYIVPIYAWQVAKRILPDRAVIAYKDETDWEKIDDSFTFLFSLHSNDLVELKTKKETFFGYYGGCNRSTGAIDIKEHDLDSSKGKNGIHASLGIKTALCQEVSGGYIGQNLLLLQA